MIFNLKKNTKKVYSVEGAAIPDAITEKSFIEIKDTKNVYFTKQIRIEYEAAQAQGKSLVIYTGENTNISKNIKNKKDIETERLQNLGPQK